MLIKVTGATSSGQRFDVEVEMESVPGPGDLVEYDGAVYAVEARNEDNSEGDATRGTCHLRPARPEDVARPRRAIGYRALEKIGSRILLPLRTSVDLFSDPSQPSALTRAKQAAALHDIVVIEVGFLDITLTPHGGSIWRTPPEGITEEHIARARTPPERGKPMALSIGLETTPGTPAQNMHTVVSGDISMAYGAEWHSEVLRPLRALGADFVEEVATPGGDISTFDPLGEAIRQQNSRDSFDKTLMPGANTFERDFIYKSFNRDMAVAEEVGAVVQVSTLFEPMLQHRGRQPTGATAVQIAAPNLRGLRWEDVLEFRQHPGAEEARHMLREFERLALEQETQDANEFLLGVSQQVSDGLFKALNDRRVRLARAVAEEAAKTGIAFIPFAGTFIEKTITAVELGAAKLAESRSGVAALMKLRDL